jgi:2-phosphosulfolactate phosphatase
MHIISHKRFFIFYHKSLNLPTVYLKIHGIFIQNPSLDNFFRKGYTCPEIILWRAFMNIQILHMVEGAKAARGLTVIIDVFRAFTVETYLMRNNAYRIYPVGDVQTAFDYQAAHPETTLLCGERNGITIEGFDFGNSPSQLEHEDLTGKSVVHTTSAGTQGIANAVHADEIITGSLVNAAAIAEYIRRKNPETVSLVCMGLNCLHPIEEDTLCAEYIQSL